MSEFTGEVHPVAALFPMLAEDELRELAEDIKANGLLQPVVLDVEGRLLDGRNRLAACKIAGVEPEFMVFDGASPEHFALSVNIARRHLSKGQRAMLVVASGEYTEYTEADAEAQDLSKQYVSRARVVARHAPDLVRGVIAGAPLNEAYDDALTRKRRKERIDALSDELSALVDAESITLEEAEARVKEAKRLADEAERASKLPTDLRERVEQGHMAVDEAEAVQRERAARLQQWGTKVKAALRTLGRMANAPVPDGLADLLTDPENQVLDDILAALEGGDYGFLE